MANTDKRVDELSNLSSLTGDELVLLQDPTTLEYGKTTLANVSAKSPVTSVAGKTGAVSLTKDDVGLSNVNDTSDADKTISTATQTALDTKATTTALTAHTTDTSNPHSVTKAQVGLGNVQNLAPADMPVSTDTQTALDAKANASDTVNLTGNQTVAGVKTFSSSPIVPTATTNTQAVNKAQMDTADALKVNKAGDTMTGSLIITPTVASTTALAVTNTAGIPLFTMDNTAGNEVTVVNLRPRGDNVRQFGSSSLYWKETYAKKLFLNSTATLDGSTAGEIKGTGIFTADNIKRGTGFPEGVVTANVGTVYIDTAVTNGASSWIKKSGTGSTGWKVLDGDTGLRTFSPTSGTGSIYAHRTGNVILLRVDLSSTSSTISNGEQIGVLPSGYRPTFKFDSLYGEAGGTPNKLITANTSGTIAVWSTPTPSVSLTATIMFTTADQYPSS